MYGAFLGMLMSARSGASRRRRWPPAVWSPPSELQAQQVICQERHTGRLDSWKGISVGGGWGAVVEGALGEPEPSSLTQAAARASDAQDIYLGGGASG